MTPDPHLDSRRRMVDEQIRSRGVRDGRVLDAMERIPREQFIPPMEAPRAFEDRALPIAHGQTISQPFMVAAMSATLELGPSHRVLEIGTGSGYQTAILAVLAKQVYTIERIAPLQEAARGVLADLGIRNVVFRVGDGTAGWPEEAPFDRIVVTAGAPDIPQSLLDQLADGGRLVIPVGRGPEQMLTVIDRTAGRLHETPRFPCRFVRLIGREGWHENEPEAVQPPE